MRCASCRASSRARTTGTPIQLMIENTDQRSKDYGEIAQSFRPGHADITYHQKYGMRDQRGGGRSSARETASRVAAGGVARAVLALLPPQVRITGYMVQMGPHGIDRSRFDAAEIERNPFWCPDAVAAGDWADYLDELRLSHNSVGAVIEVVAEGVPAGPGRAALRQARQRSGGGDDVDQRGEGRWRSATGMAAAALTGVENADEIRMGPDGPEYPVEPCGRHPGRHLHRASRWWCASR